MTKSKGCFQATKQKPKNIAILPILHARAKASAAMQGQELQEWIAAAIQEKLDREDRRRAS